MAESEPAGVEAGGRRKPWSTPQVILSDIRRGTENKSSNSLPLDSHYVTSTSGSIPS